MTNLNDNEVKVHTISFKCSDTVKGKINDILNNIQTRLKMKISEGEIIRRMILAYNPENDIPLLK